MQAKIHYLPQYPVLLYFDIASLQMQRGLARARFVSPTGQCRPFDSEADEYCHAEGCAAFVLKKRSTTLAENDRMVGVIKGTGVSHSGSADSITHPHAKTQQALFEVIFDGVEPASGGASFAELLMMMAHGRVPPQAGLKVLNPKIAAIKRHNTDIPRKLLDWPRWKDDLVIERYRELVQKDPHLGRCAYAT
ncbi:hypothetical protein DL765_004753 [Monosporascus sp. GIB2]|nr:hypothetical protein DL765_004753 [Monosporascus sp. GIB2]